MTTHPRYALSLGAGVQSTSVGLAMAEGLIAPAEVAIFADTGGEPAYVYEHLTKLEVALAAAGIPVIKVSAGNLRDDTLTKKSVSPPVWVKKSDGKSGGPGFRGCTDKYKVRPIEKWLRQWAEVKRGATDIAVNLAIGISTDEALRRKDSRTPFVHHTFPLLDDLNWSRDDCIAYLDSKDWGETPKSACIYCPFHSDELWAEVKALDPAGWDDAVVFDQEVRNGTRQRDEGGLTFYLHRSLKPLDLVVLPEYVPGAAGEGVGCSPFACPGDTIAAMPLPFEENVPEEVQVSIELHREAERHSSNLASNGT